MKLILILTILLSSNITIAESGGHTGNGGGLSEINLVSVWESLDDYLENIIESKLYTLKEEAFIAKLLENQKREPESLFFTNPRLNPELFSNDLKKFSTGMSVGSLIHINQDALYKTVKGERVSFNTVDALNLVITILNTRYMADTQGIIKKNQKLFGPLSQTITLKSYKRPDIGIELLNVGTKKVYLTSEENKIDITDKILESIKCFANKDDISYEITNMIFDDLGIVQANKTEVFFTADISFTCDTNKFDAQIEIVSKLELRGEDINQNWQYDPNTTSKVIGSDVELYNILAHW